MVTAVNANGSVECEADNEAYQNVVTVAKAGGDFTSIQAALDSIGDASATNPYLVWVGPGTYSERVTMKPFVDIEGSGQEQTTIKWTGGSEAPALGTGAATLVGASNAGLRLLGVRSDGTGQSWAIAIYNPSSSPRMTNVAATASGGSRNFGVYNSSSSPVIQHTTLSASGGSGENTAVYQNNGSAKVANSQLVGTVYESAPTALTCFDNYDANLAAVSC
jgi:hypothetical protein